MKSVWWRPAGMLFLVMLASAALALSSWEVTRSRDREKQRLEEQTVAQCVALNQSRTVTQESNMALVLIALRNSPVEELSPILRDFILYNRQAFDPVSCDPHDPLFGVDPTPPDSLPPNPLVEAIR